MNSAKFIPFTIEAFSATGIYGAEIKLDIILEMILAISPISPFSHEKISGSYFNGHVPSSDISRNLTSANMRNILADHMKSYWSPYGIFHLVSTHNNLLTHEGDNIFPGNLCGGIRAAFVVRPQEGGWLIFTVSLDLPVAVTPEYRIILPYNPLTVN